MTTNNPKERSDVTPLAELPELLPCPICNGARGRPLLDELSEDAGGGWTVACYGCHFKIFNGWYSPQDAADIWNDRPALTAHRSGASIASESEAHAAQIAGLASGSIAGEGATSSEAVVRWEVLTAEGLHHSTWRTKKEAEEVASPGSNKWLPPWTFRPLYTTPTASISDAEATSGSGVAVTDEMVDRFWAAYIDDGKGGGQINFRDARKLLTAALQATPAPTVSAKADMENPR